MKVIRNHLCDLAVSVLPIMIIIKNNNNDTFMLFKFLKDTLHKRTGIKTLKRQIKTTVVIHIYLYMCIGNNQISITLSVHPDTPEAGRSRQEKLHR